MKKNGKSRIAIGLAALTIFAFVGCAGDEDSGSSGIVERVIDTMVLAAVDNLESAGTPQAGSADGDCNKEQGELPAIDLAVTIENPPDGLPRVNDMILENSLVYAAYDGGLLIYDLKSRDYSITAVDENLTALASHAGDLFAGGGGLYKIEGAELVPVETRLKGEINDLYSYGPSLMIGTGEGLFARNILGTVCLLEDMDVSAIVEDHLGLWVGTSGQGLFHWNGERFKKRFLVRDESLFDNVTALDFNHNHLYLGTDQGMYVYDGGRWETVSIDKGLPSNRVTSVDASEWVVYVGTESGLVSYFDNEISPVHRLGNKAVSVVRTSGRRIIAGTSGEGLVMKAGPAVTTLVNPWEDSDSGLASLAH